MSSDHDLLTTTEAARVLGVTRNAVAGMIREGRLPGIRVGSRLFLPRQDVERFSAGYTSHYSRRSKQAASSETVWHALEVIAEVGEECTTAELAVALDRHEGNARKYVLILRQRGFVESTPTGHRITEAGRSHLEDQQLGAHPITSAHDDISEAAGRAG